MHLSPDFIESFHQPSTKDMAIVMPMRRPSTSTRRSSLFANAMAKLLSSSTSFKVSELSDIYASDSSLLDKTYHSRIDELLQSGTKSRGVRFAPQPTSETAIIMGLDEYSTDEIEACWYTPEDLDRMQPRKSRRKSSTKKKKRRFQCPCKLLKGNSRWTA